jgi:hypothetical protein
MIVDAIITPGYSEGYLADMPLYNLTIFVNNQEIKVTDRGRWQPKFQEDIEKALTKNQQQ